MVKKTTTKTISTSTTNNTTETRTRGASKADLLIGVLSKNTLEERVAVITALSPSKSVVRKAAIELRTNDDICGALEAYAATQGYSIFARRGRYSPRVGETRVYNVQRVKDDATFIRLPLSSLGVDRGNKVRVDFENGAVIVRALSI